ncbi:uncharacterized protein SOCG_01028 [Schizosaccharomyces octosporus yFS286]|uniref:Uncharacterized protein n=1 Tax=Schizosaccharomyces octosporus (strain yFS286) TaxID=483514 RepID=S9R4J9_SCHOY|nr:uncharacterized protein SOCG_01028 [Schizosaccharomyces octosporus yFS286]EPX73275.1 hypothetical protein SOCG_01028 [Schizosaccharomyces octosporus yFS286]
MRKLTTSYKLTLPLYLIVMRRFTSKQESPDENRNYLYSSHTGSRLNDFNEYLNEFPEAGPLTEDEEYQTLNRKESITDEVGDESSLSSNKNSGDRGRVRLMSFDALGSIFSSKPKRKQNQKGGSTENSGEEDSEELLRDQSNDRDLNLLDYL